MPGDHWLGFVIEPALASGPVGRLLTQSRLTREQAETRLMTALREDAGGLSNNAPGLLAERSAVVREIDRLQRAQDRALSALDAERVALERTKSDTDEFRAAVQRHGESKRAVANEIVIPKKREEIALEHLERDFVDQVAVPWACWVLRSGT